MKKNRIISITAAALLALSAMPVLAASAEGEEPAAEQPASAQTAKVRVSIADAGKLKIGLKDVTVSDADSDGKLTIYDTLYAAHEAYYDGGAEKGFAAEESQWGLSLKTLWGVTNGGSFGYTVNNQFANGLADEVSDGDLVYAYTYADTTGFSDLYTYFDASDADVAVGVPLTLTLKSLSFDENYQPVEKPVAGAVIVEGTYNDKDIYSETDYVTDEEGKVKVTAINPGEGLITALRNDITIVPPVMQLNVKENLGADVTVTIANEGKTVLNKETVTVFDSNLDGKLTIDEALYWAHAENYEEGVEKGYASTETQSGTFLTTLWGVTNGGSFGFTVNNRFANSLDDEVKEGDVIYAYVYQDTEKFSDVYTFFTPDDVEAKEGENVTLTLKKITFDESYNQIEAPVEGAKLVINGEKKTDLVTDKDGNVTFKADKAGKYEISAVSDSEILVPPTAALSVEKDSSKQEDDGNTTGSDVTAGDQPAPKTGDAGTGIFVAAALTALGAAFALRRRHED